MVGELKKNNSLILDYIKSNNINLKIVDLGELSNKLRDIIALNTFDNSDDIIIEKTIFETTDKKIFNDKEQALNHQILTNQVNEIIELLGGNDLVDQNGFSDGQGYYLLDKYKLKLAGELSQVLQKELGLEDYSLTSKMCYENEYLGAISQTLICIGTLDDGTKVRVGQAYFVSNMDKVGNKIYNPEVLEQASIRGSEDGQQVVDSMSNSSILVDLKTNLENLRETENDTKIEELEINITNICETILNGFDDGLIISEEEFNKIYKEFVKKDDFLEDEHVELLKNIKQSFNLPQIQNQQKQDNDIDYSKLKMKELIEELRNSLVSGENIMEVAKEINNKLESGKGLKEENYQSFKLVYKELVKGNDDIDKKFKIFIKDLKESFEEKLPTQENSIDRN